MATQRVANIGRIKGLTQKDQEDRQMDFSKFAIAMCRSQQLVAGFITAARDTVTTQAQKSPEKDPDQVPFPTRWLPISLGDTSALAQCAGVDV
jgi:hypothetical protein